VRFTGGATVAMKRVVAAGFLGVLALLVLLTGVRWLARSRSFQTFGELIPRVEITAPVIALTFDDGPAPGVADTLIGYLDAAGVRATFFVTGQELAANLDLGQRLVEAGHELGNHTYAHARMVLRSQKFIRSQIERTDDLIRDAGQGNPIFFRPPYGYKLVGLPYYLARTGRTTILWDIEPDSYPEVAATSEGIVRHVLDRVRPGSIILLHPWYSSRRTSLQAVPALVDSLQGRGYTITTVGELMRIADRHTD
jgi:peptidoglycan-N-acetylglucosamine deacetylase